MKVGNNKTRKGDRQIVSVSLPLPVYDALQELSERYSMNRSALIAKAISDYLKDLGLKVGER